MEVDILRVLKYCAPFDSLDDDFLSQLAKNLKVEKYKRGSYVFRKGQKSLQILFLIADGRGEVIVTDARGQEIVVSTRRQYDFFGETALLTNNTYGGSFKAAEDLTCLLVPRGKIEEITVSHPEFSSYFTTLLAERLHRLYEESVSQQSNEVYSTIARGLVN